MYQCAGKRVTVLYIRTGGQRRRGGGRRRGPQALRDRPRARCRTSSRCAATRRTASRARRASARRPPPSCSSGTARCEAAIDGAVRESKPSVRKALMEQRDELLRFKRDRDAPGRPTWSCRPTGPPTSRAGAAAARERGMNRLAERLGEGGVKRAADCAVVVRLCAAAPAAQARDPGRWVFTGASSIPTIYWQGLTSDPRQASACSSPGSSRGSGAPRPGCARRPASAAAIPADVKAPRATTTSAIRPGRRAGGVLLPMECYDPGGGGNSCGNGAFGVADPATLAWRYYVKLDPAEIPKAMWAETSPDGKLDLDRCSSRRACRPARSRPTSPWGSRPGRASRSSARRAWQGRRPRTIRCRRCCRRRPGRSTRAAARTPARFQVGSPMWL